MNYDDWKTAEPNDMDVQDPASDDCPDCGAGHDEPCLPECGCRYCRLRDALKAEALVPVGIGSGEK